MTAVSRCISAYYYINSNTFVILLGDIIRDNPWVVQAEMEGCKV